MTAAQKALDALEAAGKSGACPPWDAATLATNLAAPLAAVVRAAMEYRVHRIEFGSTVGATYRDVRQSRNKLDAALDAFAVAAQEMFP